MNVEKNKQVFSFRYIVLLLASPIIVGTAIVVLFAISALLGYPLAKNIVQGNHIAYFAVFLFLTFYLLDLALIYIKIRHLKNPWTELGINKFPIGKSTAYIIGYFLFIFGILIVFSLVGAALGLGDSNSQQQPDSIPPAAKSFLLLGGFWNNLIVTVIFAPFVEEILFRGIIFKKLDKRFGLLVGVLLSSFIFSLYHLNPIQMIITFPLGIYLCVMYRKLGSIVPGMFLHALWNLFVSVVMFAMLNA